MKTVEQIAKDLGLSITATEVFLDLPVSAMDKASTAKEMSSVYYDISSGTEAKKLALEKWERLAVEEMKSASTVKAMQDLYYALPDNKDMKRDVLYKWEMLSMSDVKAASSFEEVEKAFYNTPRDSESRSLVILKWAKYASTVDEIKKVWRYTPTESGEQTESRWYGSKNPTSYEIVLLKWIELAQTIKDIKEICEQTRYESVERKAILIKCIKLAKNRSELRYVYGWAKGDSLIGPYEDIIMNADKKREKMLFEEVRNVSTAKEARSIFESSPEESEVQNIAWEKFEELALSDVDEVNTVESLKKLCFPSTSLESNDYRPAESSKLFALTKWMNIIETSKQIRDFLQYCDNEEIRKMAEKKWARISLKKAQAASNLKEARIAYDEAMRGSEAEGIAWKKIDEFSATVVEKITTVDEAETVYDFMSSSRQEKLILKMIEIAATAAEIEKIVEKYKSKHNHFQFTALLKMIELASTGDDVKKALSLSTESRHDAIKKAAAKKMFSLLSAV